MFHTAVLGALSELSAQYSMVEGGRSVSLYHPFHVTPIGYGVLSDGGEKSLRRMIHGNAIFNGPEEDFVAIRNFLAVTSYICLGFPN